MKVLMSKMRMVIGRANCPRYTKFDFTVHRSSMNFPYWKTENARGHGPLPRKVSQRLPDRSAVDHVINTQAFKLHILLFLSLI